MTTGPPRRGCCARASARRAEATGARLGCCTVERCCATRGRVGVVRVRASARQAEATGARLGCCTAERCCASSRSARGVVSSELVRPEGLCRPRPRWRHGAAADSPHGIESRHAWIFWPPMHGVHSVIASHQSISIVTYCKSQLGPRGCPRGSSAPPPRKD